MNATQAHGSQNPSAQTASAQTPWTQTPWTQSPSEAKRAPRLRLTRRGRFVFTSLAAGPLIALALVAALNGGIAAATSDLSTGSFDYVTVEAGQSLWGLAQSVAPAADPRDVISDIVRLNQLQNSELHPGDRIAIPASYSK